MSNLIGNNELMHKLFPFDKLTSLQEGLNHVLTEKMLQFGKDTIYKNQITRKK